MAAIASRRRAMFAAAGAVVLGGGITAGAAAKVADLLPSDTADAVLLAICARAEEQDRLMHVVNDLQKKVTREHGRCPETNAARKQCDVHFDTFVDLAEEAAVIPALTVDGMRAKARVVYLNMNTTLNAGELTTLILRDLGWGA